MQNNKNIHGNCATMRKVAIVHVCCAQTICCACKYDHCEINYCACCTFVAPLLCTIQVLCMQYYFTLHKHCTPVAYVLCIRCNCCALCICTNTTEENILLLRNIDIYNDTPVRGLVLFFPNPNTNP